MRANITVPIETLVRIMVTTRTAGNAVDDDGVDEPGDEEGTDGGSGVFAWDGASGAVEDQEDDELTELLASLSDAELAELLAVMWVGGGEYDEGNWDDALSRARALRDRDEIMQVLSADDLGVLIEDGLIELGYAVLNEDGPAAA